ncbi:MAG: response regulator [Candidatus Cloacimonetes bacterium]|nr:response regulator [Candidatus Cloacimonadota bacterium]
MKLPRILLVDDSAAILNSLSAILKISGYEVETAYNGSEALRRIHSEDFDLVICDIEMPGITGLDFLGRVRRDYDRELDVILMTGFLDHEYFIEAIRLGAADFIRKPIDTKQIIRSIQGLVERKQNRNDFSDFYSHLDHADFSFVLNPKHFSKFALSKVFNSFLRQNFHLSHSELNEILICVDEMVYNAFIHGILKLTNKERVLDHKSLQQLILQRLQIPENAEKRMRFAFCIDHQNETLNITVEDDGDGFDYEAWLLRVAQETKLNLDEHGRGISMLYHLADKLEFSDGGRKVSIIKKILQHPHHETG